MPLFFCFEFDNWVKRFMGFIILINHKRIFYFVSNYKWHLQEHGWSWSLLCTGLLEYERWELMQTTSLCLLFIPVSEVHHWNVKQIHMNCEIQILCLALTLLSKVFQTLFFGMFNSRQKSFCLGCIYLCRHLGFKLRCFTIWA